MLTAWVIVIGATSSLQAFEKPTKSETVEERKLAIKKWESVLGPLQVRAGQEEQLYWCLSHVDVRPKAAFTKWTDERLPHGLIELSQEWMEKFFTDKGNPYKNTIKGMWYYLGKEKETSLIAYEWNDEDHCYWLTESYTAVLLRVMPSKWEKDEENAVSHKHVRRIISEIVKLDDDSGFGGSAKKVEDFRLPDRAPIGHVFSTVQELQGVNVNGWLEQIVCIVGDNGVSVLMFKAPAGRMAGEFRRYPEAFRNSILDADGVTLLKDKRRRSKQQEDKKPPPVESRR